jgi:hypothetical protein
MNVDLAYDAPNNRSLLFGGFAGKTYLADTWAWDGILWRQLSDMGPPARCFYGLCVDTTRHRGVLFGGQVGIGQSAGDTWEYFDQP